MNRRPPRATRTDPLFPYTTLFRSADRVNRSPNQGMGSEDFSIMLARRPGAFVWLGGGAPGKDWGLHHPKYDFNDDALPVGARSEEHTSELQSLMRTSYAVFCLKKKKAQH